MDGAAKTFTRTRKLPLAHLIGALLHMRAQSHQVTLDSFFASLKDAAQLSRVASDRAFARARDRLNWGALANLNTWLLERVQTVGLTTRWQGMRVVAADASVLMPAVRACHLGRRAARADQRLFTLYLPDSELTLHASVHGDDVPERQMLFEALDCLGPDDVLVLDRGYPAAWLIAYLIEHGIRFCMRCDNTSGWKVVRQFMRAGKDEDTVTLSVPDADDVRDYGCPSQAPKVRLVRCIAPNGQVRVLATNLSAAQAPCTVFGDLYHKRWRIEEAYKRVKHRMKLESVSGLSQHALLVDVATKILADNLAALACMGAMEHVPSQTKHPHHCNRAYAAAATRQALPRLLLGLMEEMHSLLDALMSTLARNTCRRTPGRTYPRPEHHRKPHPTMAYKG